MITQPTVDPKITALSDEDLALLGQYDREQLGELYRQIDVLQAQVKPLQRELAEVGQEADFRMGLELEYGFVPSQEEQPETP